MENGFRTGGRRTVGARYRPYGRSVRLSGPPALRLSGPPSFGSPRLPAPLTLRLSPPSGSSRLRFSPPSGPSRTSGPVPVAWPFPPVRPGPGRAVTAPDIASLS
ncbi:hypothetical protein GCM10017752_23720 [Streptomyces roseoviridis]